MIPLKKVSARGRRYAYIRGTDIALVRGFVGTADQFDSAVAAAVTAYGVKPMKSSFDGFRSDAAKVMHKLSSNRAREAGRSYSLSVAAITQMLIAARDQCTITAIPFDYRGNATDFRIRPMGPSLDRIDNKLGYDASNVRVVCTCVNIALNEWGLDNFELVCRSFLLNLENRRMLDGKPASTAAVTA